MMLRTLTQLSRQPRAEAGAKAVTLARLRRAGLPVPDGFVLLPAAFAGDDLRPEAWAQAHAHLTALRGPAAGVSFAVRSSAQGEDSARASFAGAFETVLDATSDDAVRQAIAQVRASRHHARVRAYRQAQGLEPAAPEASAPDAAAPEAAAPEIAAPEVAAPEVAVVVQRLVPADFSGVIFTAEPLSGDLMRMTGNYVEGPGEALVSGSVTPRTFTLARPGGAYAGPPEIAAPARALYRAACRIEALLGGPQDIEWAVAGGRLWILQARPITTMVGYKPETAEWNDSLRGRFLWSGANLAENAPFTLTPFSASLRKGLPYKGVDLGDGSAMGLDGYPLAGIVGGRAYINLSVQVSALRPLFGGDTRKALAQVTAFWGGVPEGQEIPLVPVPRRTWWLRVLPRLARVGLLMARLRRRIPAYVAASPRRCAELIDRIDATSSGPELASLWRTRIAPYSLESFYLANAGATDLPARLESDLRAIVGAEDASALLSHLGGLSAALSPASLGPLESLGPLTGLDAVARGTLSRAAWLEAYGHRGVNEVEYAWPRPLEDPAWLDRRLAEYARSPMDFAAIFARQQAAFDAAWARLEAQHPAQAKPMRRRLEAAAQAARLREAVRSEATRSALVVRRFALRAGALCALGEEIFFLTIDEVLALLEGDGAALRYLPARKQAHARLAALPPYPTLIAGRFDPLRWAADPNRRSDLFDASAPALAPDSVPDSAPALATDSGPLQPALHGFAGANGIVEGRVRRLDHLDQSGELEAGEVLVTTMTNIGWTPLFARAAAIVTDLGAPLSHAAIVARELGIPSVVGCGDATMRLRTGDRVRVDGGRGLVEILDKAPPDAAAGENP